MISSVVPRPLRTGSDRTWLGPDRLTVGELGPFAAFGLLLFALVVGCAPDSEERDLDFHRGRNALALNRAEWARLYYEADLERNPWRLESMRGAARSWRSGSEGSLAKSIEWYEKLVAADPTDTDARLRLAEAQLRNGASAKAADSIRGLTGFDSDLVAARVLIDQRPEEAVARSLSALEVDPESFAGHLLAARAYARLGTDDQALRHAERASSIDPNHTTVFYLVGSLWQKRGELQRADAAFERHDLLRRLDSPTLAVAERVDLWRRLEALRADRQQPVAVGFVTTLLDAGHFGEAGRLARELMEPGQSTPNELFSIAMKASEKGRATLARELCAEVLRREEAHRGAVTQLAALSLRAGDLTEAKRLVAMGHERHEHSAPLHYIQGSIALREGRDTDGVRALERAVELAPWLTNYRIALAEAMLANGDPDGAQRLLDEAPRSGAAPDASEERSSW